MAYPNHPHYVANPDFRLLQAGDAGGKRGKRKVSSRIQHLPNTRTGIYSEDCWASQGAVPVKHAVLMIIGCLVPLLLIFILPALGVSNEVVLVIGVVLMVGCHLLMIGHHEHGKESDERSHKHN
jgi:hypothetical protein